MGFSPESPKDASWECLMKWDYLLKEWVGWLVYKMKGYN